MSKKLSKNKEQEIMIGTAMISGGRNFCELVGEVAKGIDVKCRCVKALNLIDDPKNNIEVLMNELANAYNVGVGSFPGAFKHCYGKDSEKISVYRKRLHDRIYNACQGVYDSGSSLAGMSKAEVMRSIQLFEEQLL